MKNYRLFIYLSFIPLTLTSCGGSKGLKSTKFKLSSLGNEVSFHTELQSAFIKADDPDDFIEEHLDEFASEDKSKPNNKITVNWTSESNNGEKPKYYDVELFEGEKRIDWVQTVENTAVFYPYLKVNQKYTWTVTARYEKKSFTSEPSEFKTSNEPIRNIDVSGLQNVRDLGGWTTESGKEIKQGLIYRTCELNSDKYDKNKFSSLDENGINAMLNNLGIKSEIDLRKTKESFNSDEVLGITSSPLGEEVEYVSLPMMYRSGVYGNNIFNNDDNKPRIKAFFEYLSDINNYPMIFHCVRGTDRTGALAYALGALCGMNETDLMRDYLFSNFARIKEPVRAGVILEDDFYVKGIRDSEGESMRDKAKHYLMEKVGVEETTLNSVINILVG